MATTLEVIKNEDFEAKVLGPNRWISIGDLTPAEEPRMHYVPISERARTFLKLAATPGGRNLWHLSVSIVPDENELIFAVRTTACTLDKALAEKEMPLLTKRITAFEAGGGDWT